MKPQIIRPQQLSDDKREEVRKYLYTQWLRAVDGRRTQIDVKYKNWLSAYQGAPLEEKRTTPFYGASNFVVKLIRMFVDTFVARTLNIVFATRPLFVTDDLPQELKEAWEEYLNRKCLDAWNYYNLTKDLTFAGNKYGTCIVKTIYDELSTIDVMPATNATGFSEQEFVYWAGPQSEIIPFEDFFVYPITATYLEKAEIKMHRRRFTPEAAKELFASGTWKAAKNPDLALEALSDADMSRWLYTPSDVKSMREQQIAGVNDSLLQEVAGIEMHFEYALGNDSSRKYNCVAVLEPKTGDLLDLYYNPYPRNLCMFTDYRPFPRDGLFYGESMSEILSQSQEEASRIHNERRDNSVISSSVCFKRRSGSLLPNPSTSWYPGKVWDLDSLDDLEVFDIGRNYQDMIEQEDYVLQQAERLSGIGEIMQGAASGTLGKRGVYNTQGTIALLQESNTRQDTNIRDVRAVLSRVVSMASKLQATYGAEDPFITTLPEKDQPLVKQALAIFGTDQWRFIAHDVKTSDAGVNKEIRRQNLMQMAQVLGQYGQTVVQMSMQLANPQLNPTIRTVMEEVVKMSKWMAERLVNEFDQPDAKEILPDLEAALSGGQAQPGGPTQPTPGPGEPSGTLPPVPAQLLAQVSSLPTPGGAPAAQGGVRGPNGLPPIPGPQGAA